jgi:hypothetical protein
MRPEGLDKLIKVNRYLYYDEYTRLYTSEGLVDRTSKLRRFYHIEIFKIREDNVRIFSSA